MKKVVIEEIFKLRDEEKIVPTDIYTAIQAYCAMLEVTLFVSSAFTLR